MKFDHPIKGLPFKKKMKWLFKDATKFGKASIILSVWNYFLFVLLGDVLGIPNYINFFIGLPIGYAAKYFLYSYFWRNAETNIEARTAMMGMSNKDERVVEQ